MDPDANLQHHLTLTERAKLRWARWGRVDRRGRVYIEREYVGRIGWTDAGRIMVFRRGERRVGYLTLDLSVLAGD